LDRLRYLGRRGSAVWILSGEPGSQPRPHRMPSLRIGFIRIISRTEREELDQDQPGNKSTYMGPNGDSTAGFMRICNSGCSAAQKLGKKPESQNQPGRKPDQCKSEYPGQNTS